MVPLRFSRRDCFVCQTITPYRSATRVASLQCWVMHDETDAPDITPSNNRSDIKTSLTQQVFVQTLQGIGKNTDSGHAVRGKIVVSSLNGTIATHSELKGTHQHGDPTETVCRTTLGTYVCREMQTCRWSVNNIFVHCCSDIHLVTSVSFREASETRRMR